MSTASTCPGCDAIRDDTTPFPDFDVEACMLCGWPRAASKGLAMKNKFYVIEHLDSTGAWKPLCGGARKKRVIEHAATLVEDGYDAEELRIAVYVPKEVE